MSLFQDILRNTHEHLGTDEHGLNQLVPVAFRIGSYENEAGQSIGTLAVIVYADKERLTVGETLPMFGEYLDAVVENTGGQNNPNIRELMRHDRDAYVGSFIHFYGKPVVPKT